MWLTDAKKELTDAVTVANFTETEKLSAMELLTLFHENMKTDSRILRELPPATVSGCILYLTGGIRSNRSPWKRVNQEQASQASGVSSRTIGRNYMLVWDIATKDRDLVYNELLGLTEPEYFDRFCSLRGEKNGN